MSNTCKTSLDPSRQLSTGQRSGCVILGMACFLFATRVNCAEPPQAVPTDPIAGIVDAFKFHPIVALGEGNHGNLQGHAFRLSLLRDPRFQQTVNDIVVEFGNSRYQEMVDRFVTGSDIPYKDLRRIWIDTTQV